MNIHIWEALAENGGMYNPSTWKAVVEESGFKVILSYILSLKPSCAIQILNEKKKGKITMSRK